MHRLYLLKLRDLFPQSALMESADRQDPEGGRSFIGLCPIASFAVEHGKVVTRLPGGVRTEELTGDESRYLLPACALGGAALLLICDTASRTLFAPYQLPVGIMLSLIGGPFFIWLLLKQRKGRIV